MWMRSPCENRSFKLFYTSMVFSMKMIDWAIDSENEFIIQECTNILDQFQAQTDGSKESAGTQRLPSINSSFILPPRALFMDRAQEW